MCRKGGAPWPHPTGATPGNAPLILQTTRRNSCVAMVTISASLPSLQGCARAQAGRLLRFGWRTHGASNFPFDPNVSHATEPAIWRSDNCAFVVSLAGPIDRWPELLESVIGGDVTCDRTGPAGRHLIIDSHGMRHRLLLTASCEGGIPAYLLPATGPLPIRTAAITAYHFRNDRPASLADTGPLNPTPFQHHRLRLILAVLDARSGAGQPPRSLRQTAAAILGDDLTRIRAIEWKTASRRRHIQRLHADGLKLVKGGYRELLNARPPSKSANVG